MIATITEVIQVSRRLVQVILRASARTSRKNWAMLVFFFGAALRERGRRRHDRGGLGGAVLHRLRGRTRFPGHTAYVLTHIYGAADAAPRLLTRLI